MANRKGYATVYWGKMPVNFRCDGCPLPLRCAPMGQYAKSREVR